MDIGVRLDTNKRVAGTGNTDFGGKHMFAIDYKNKHEKIFESYFKFAFVRNPWELEVSLFKWFKRVLPAYNMTLTNHLRSRSRTNKLGFDIWICDKNGNNLVDFIGRFENLQKDFNIICDKIGIPQRELPHKNKGNHKHYTEYYDDEAREIVAEKYAKDIEYFGYEYGE